MTVRLFIGLWLNNAATEELAGWAKDAQSVCGGRIMPVSNMHLTLAFLGAVNKSRVQELIRMVTDWKFAAPTFALQEFGYFANARVVWAGPTDEGDKLCLNQIYSKLWQHLNVLGWYATEETFRPHVSLLRNAKTADLSGLKKQPVICTATSLNLVASQPSNKASNYQVLASASVQ